MKPRVCIFAAETLLHWSGYYIRAFRQCCDVIVVGPPIEPDNHDYPDWNRVEACVVKNDIYSTSADAQARLATLPTDWTPDLVVGIQSGEVPIRGIARVCCPSVYISVDTWHDPREFQHAHQYDFVFLAQKALVKYMRQMGCCRVFWLPLACDPEYHFVVEAKPFTHDIAFVGRTHFYTNRQRRKRLELLESNFRVEVYFGLGPMEMAVAYGQSRLIFNASIACDVNMRVFEAMATGRPLVTNREAEKNGLFDLFEDGVHLISYDDRDLVAQVRRYLDDPVAAQTIAEAGQREVLERHTYVHRVMELLDTLRAHHITPPSRFRPVVRASGRVRDLVSPGSLRILDVGLGLNASRVAMGRQGVDYLAGVALDEESFHRRKKSYDTIWMASNMPAPTHDFDTVIWTVEGRCGSSIEAMIASAREWLVEGGRLLFFVSDEELSSLVGKPDAAALTKWLWSMGCRFLLAGRSEQSPPLRLISASLLTTNADEVNRAMYHEFPANGTDTQPWKGVKPDPEHDSPTVEGP